MPEDHTKMGSKDAPSRELQDLRLVIDWGFGTLIPLTVLFTVIGSIANSMTIYTVAFEFGLSIAVNAYALVVIRIILRKNTFSFPYGVGKLENFTSFLYGALLMPSGLFFIYTAVGRLISPPEAVKLGICQVPMAISLVRSLCLLMFISRTARRHRPQTPIMHSYMVNYKVSAVVDAGVMAALGLGLFLERIEVSSINFMIDPVVTLLLSAYMLINGGKLIVKNFESLMDLPLPEEDQLKILRVIAREYANFENIGLVYTRRSGNTRFVELELVFDSNSTLSNIAVIEQRIRSGLSEHFPDLAFRLISMTSGMDKRGTN